MKEMEQVRSALQGDVTCAMLSVRGELHTSSKKGIAPIMEVLATDPKFLQGALVADRVIGKAAAMLLVKAGIWELYAEVISEHARMFLEVHNIPITYSKVVPYIINRKGDGMCPMEATVLDMKNVNEAYVALQNKVAELQAK
ncbi:DUF1893 domain-containing protein [Chakrabartyella piscis]|uniref:DUF1893 domain-containing protein n=1 Tax=Chakrabartyella piscis TaxID=2918914 RepID=UPI0029584900|nr:DUF1893 domain-containing protein [Chakrabartyella piscis]